jgi:hypothetical protein
MKKNLLMVLAVTASFGLIFGVSEAYFNYAGQAANKVFMTGKLELEIASSATVDLTNWRPGETKSLEYSLFNSGTLPVDVKAFLAAGWSTAELDEAMVNLVGIERLTASGWESITAGPGLEDEFVLGEVAPDQTVEIRLNIQLDESATNEYQDQQLIADLHVAGKQVDAGATWPLTY